MCTCNTKESYQGGKVFKIMTDLWEGQEELKWVATEEDHDDGNEDDGKIALALLLARRVDSEFLVSDCFVYPTVEAEEC